MIVVKIEGGLANKMFQYALYKALLQFSNEVYVDENSFKPAWTFEEINLSQIFENVEIKGYNSRKFRLAKKQGLFGKSLKVLFEKVGYKYYREKEFKYDNSIFQLKDKNIYLTGFWQSEKYFKQIESVIRSDFKFRNFEDPKNIDISILLGQEESVSIHIRKGADYNKKITHGTCEIEYYIKAINYIKSKKKDLKFYVFSDNPDWVLENLKELDYTLINWNPTSGVNNYLDMQLMSLAKNNIIANSSYSWWGAWLNTNPYKIVIAPEIWFNPQSEIKETPDIIPKDWVKI